MKNGKRNRRRRYWIDPGFQGRFLRMILTLLFAVLFFGIVMPVFFCVIVLESASMQGPSSPLVVLAAGALAFVISACIARLTIRMSHRICGPVFRIQKSLECMKRGERPQRIVLRKGDELVELVELLNEVVDSLFGSADAPPQAKTLAQKDEKTGPFPIAEAS